MWDLITLTQFQDGWMILWMGIKHLKTFPISVVVMSARFNPMVSQFLVPVL